MKKLMPWIIALSVFSGGGLLAQDITGTWQGTLQVYKQELRTVIKISKADGGGLKAVLYSIGQSGQGFAGKVTLEGSIPSTCAAMLCAKPGTCVPTHTSQAPSCTWTVQFIGSMVA